LGGEKKEMKDNPQDKAAKKKAEENLEKLIRHVASHHQADILLVSGSIRQDLEQRVRDALEDVKKKSVNLIVLLTTGGGSADCAFRIARVLRHAYHRGSITVHVYGFCKSAGTLLVLGADEIVMSDNAELGPIDVQLAKPDELMEWTSGLTPREAFGALGAHAFATFEKFFLTLRKKSDLQITTRTAADIAAEMTVGLFGPIYAQLDPLRIGEIQRALSIAVHYGTMLDHGNQKDDTVRTLLMEYPSHEFVIDREQAQELFNEVREPTNEEALLQSVFEPHALGHYEDPLVKYLSTTPGHQTKDNTNVQPVRTKTPESTSPEGSAGEVSPPSTLDVTRAKDGQRQRRQTRNDD
jgi:Ni,Fe-hydrogenase III small subunit